MQILNNKEPTVELGSASFTERRAQEIIPVRFSVFVARRLRRLRRGFRQFSTLSL